MNKLLVVFLLNAAINIPGHSQGIRINEIMPSNNQFLQDREGHYPDWIEIYNAGSDTVNLLDYALSDNNEKRMMWLFPQVDLFPGSYLLVLADNRISEVPVRFWETLVREGDEWKYILPRSDLSLSWKDLAYSDDGWNSGPSGFGYGDNDDATILPSGTMSVYLRKEFNITDPSEIHEMLFHMDYDDAFVAYINGKEIARRNIGSSGRVPAFNEPALSYLEPLMINGIDPDSFHIKNPGALLFTGKNILAVEVHNYSESSSDLTAIPFLSIQTRKVPEDQPLILPGTEPAVLHAPFKLDADGDSIYLSNPDGKCIDSILFEQIPMGLSMGKSPDGSDSRLVFEIPTPGRSNESRAYEGVVTEKPSFSSGTGFYSSPLTLSLSSSNPSAKIYYTVDGSLPDSSSSFYSGPLSLNKSTVIQARIIRKGFISGPVATKTYLLERKPSLPVMLVNTDPMNLWDYNTGIYVKGPNAEEQVPFFNANFWMDWEKPARVTLMEPDGQLGFDINAGVRIVGAYSRAHPMKSLGIYARSKYGDKNIPYAIFPEKNINKYEAFILRNSGNDWHGENAGSGSMFRDMLTGELINELNIDHQAGRQAAVYINGKYWGIHNIREKINEHFLAENHNVHPDSVDILENNSLIMRGSKDHYEEMISYLQSHNIRQDEHYQYISSRMDIQEFIDYCIVEIFIFNGDWPGNNKKFWKTHQNGKWRWILFDTDYGFGIWDSQKVYNNTLVFATATDGPVWPNPPWSTYLLRRLLENETFRNQFINSFADRMNTIFLPSNINEKINLLKGNIDKELPYHIVRWNGNQTAYNNVIYQMKVFANRRKTILEDYILSFFGLPAKHTLTISTNDEQAGVVRVNTLKMNKLPWSGIYYEDIPVKIQAIPAPGYEFVEWTGSIQSSNPETEISLSGESYAIANFRKSDEAERYPIVINEISYKAAENADSEDWLELYNNSDQPRELSGWIVKDSDDSHFFSIDENTIIGPREFLIISRDSLSYRKVYPLASPLTGEFDFGLSSNGDQVRLYDSNMNLMDSVNYDITAPWSEDVNGTGFTLSLINPAMDNSLPESWTASLQLQGTPGKENDLYDGIIPANSKTVNLSLENYPNPFINKLNIKIFTERNQFINLSLFDMNGRLIKLLNDEELNAGNHSFTVETSGMPEGVYVIKLRSEEKTIYRKLLKIR